MTTATTTSSPGSRPSSTDSSRGGRRAAVGIPDWIVDATSASGELILVHPGVYRLRGVPFTQELRWLAAVLAAGPEAWLSHRAAPRSTASTSASPKPEITDRRTSGSATLDGVDRPPHPPTTRRDHRATACRSRRRRGRCSTPRRCSPTTRSSDAPAERGHRRTASRSRRCRHPRAPRRPRRDGRDADATTLAGGLVDEKIQRKLELLVARIIDARACPKPVRQYRLVCDDGGEVFLDNAWPDRKIAVEAVGLRWHGNAPPGREDREPARGRSRASGWDHLRVRLVRGDRDAGRDARARSKSFWAGSTRHAPGESLPERERRRLSSGTARPCRGPRGGRRGSRPAPR